jgi:biotin carboxyl carrier protein
LAKKQTLITRPIQQLLAHPHLTAGWLILNHKRAFTVENGTVRWIRNPASVLADLYHYLQLERRQGAAPAQMVWDHDESLLTECLAFYGELEQAFGIDSEKEFHDSVTAHRFNDSDSYIKMNESLLAGKLPPSITSHDESFKESVLASHRGWQLGLPLLDLIPLLGDRSGIIRFGVQKNLRPDVPERFLDPEKQKEFIRALAPPPAASSNEILAVMGGMYYGRETPASEPYMRVGQRFNEGDPIYIIEVMKMFNKVFAEFSGTVEKILIDDESGVVVRKGQPLYRVIPDEMIHIESELDRTKRRYQYTKELMKSLTV